MRFTLEVPIEVGELIVQALDKAVEALPTHGPEFADESWQTQQADALVSIAREYLGGRSDKPSASTADHYQIVIQYGWLGTDEREGALRSPRGDHEAAHL